MEKIKELITQLEDEIRNIYDEKPEILNNLDYINMIMFDLNIFSYICEKRIEGFDICEKCGEWHQKKIGANF